VAFCQADGGFWLTNYAGSSSPLLIFIRSTDPNQTQHVLCGPDEPQTTINYHRLDVSRDDGMDEQEIHRFFAKLMEDFGSEVAGVA
jgi:hypothetical protein